MQIIKLKGHYSFSEDPTVEASSFVSIETAFFCVQRGSELQDTTMYKTRRWVSTGDSSNFFGGPS